MLHMPPFLEALSSLSHKWGNRGSRNLKELAEGVLCLPDSRTVFLLVNQAEWHRISWARDRGDQAAGPGAPWGRGMEGGLRRG